MKRFIFSVLSLVFFFGACKESPQKSSPSVVKNKGDTLAVDYAEGFSLVRYDGYKILRVKDPFPGADKTFTYLLVEKHADVPRGIDYQAKITIPVQKIIVTSTTHIPSLDSLGEIESLVGFPHLDYISSPGVRQRIKNHQIVDIGQDEHLNTEITLSLQPDVLIGFSQKSDNKVYNNLMKSGIPVIYNGDWNERSPLGKAEWIKFFGALYNKEEKATRIFNGIKNDYQKAKKLAQKDSSRPTVLSGAMYKDIWNLPRGDSWGARLIADANANYLFRNTSGTGSLSLSIEAVLNKAQDADIWISPGAFTSYKQMRKASKHYTRFKAFQDHKVYGYAGEKGETGGVLFYELGPNRPDLVLKDLVHIFHPDMLPNYEPTFYKPLE